MTMDQVDVFAELMLTDEERVVDSQLGYPRGYAKLCGACYTTPAMELHGMVTPFTEGPPHRFLPYSPQSGDFATLKEWDGLFPTVAGVDRDPQNARKYAEELWQQLDHLGNAGFDPANFRVDPYGNVVYWNADSSSPLAWEIDHWFPHSRGGKTVVTNLRVVQWQASQRKKNRLEFLVPWWDLQHGCSINQFLSAFASKNADFRKRSFALFFSGGEDASVAREHVGECRPWPQQFREKKAQCGLAAAAIVMVHKENDVSHRPSTVPLKPLVVCNSGPGMQGARRRWSAEEEEALQRGVSRFGSTGSWKEIKETEPALANRSILQLKEKYRLVRADWQSSGKENMGANCKTDRHSSVTMTLQKELRVKTMREEEKREREAEIAQLEETVTNLKQQNERERVHAVELEAVLSKHKRRVEKQRRWAETQSSYRLCLERMIRDTMHQSISYKEQARLNQAACNALKARLDCQKAACEAAEKDLLQNFTQRGSLEASVAGDAMGSKKGEPGIAMQGRDIVDVSSCVSFLSANGTNADGISEDHHQVDKKILLQDMNLVDDDHSDSEDDATAEEVYTRRMEHRRTKDQLQEDCARKSREAEMLTSPARRSTKYFNLLPSEEVTESGRGVSEAGCQHRSYHIDADAGVGSGDVLEGESQPEESQDTAPPAAGIYDHVQRPELPEAGADITLSPKLSDQLHQVQKKIVIGEAQSDEVDYVVTSDAVDEKGVMHKEEYLDELLHHVRFQLPDDNSLEDGITADIDSPVRNSEEHLDELLHQVLSTHLERIRKNEAGRPQREAGASDVDDERLRRIGKQNLDKWLQVLLFDVESAAAGSTGPSSLGTQIDSPLHRAFSPATFSQMSAIAAMRGKLSNLEAGNVAQGVSMKKGEDHQSCVTDRPKGLWGVLLRKLSARQQQQSEQCLSNKLDAESENDEPPAVLRGTDLPRQDHTTSHQALSASNMVTGFGTRDVDSYTTTTTSAYVSSRVGDDDDGDGYQPCGNDHAATMVVDHSVMRSTLSDITEAALAPSSTQLITSTSTDPEILSDPVIQTSRSTSAQLEHHFTLERRVHFPRALSDVDEISETDSLNSTSTCELYSRQMENKDPNSKSGLRASIKAAGLVWKKAVKKLETRLQENGHPQQALE